LSNLILAKAIFCTPKAGFSIPHVLWMILICAANDFHHQKCQPDIFLKILTVPLFLQSELSTFEVFSNSTSSPSAPHAYLKLFPRAVNQ
jgi:hypothetical protein